MSFNGYSNHSCRLAIDNGKSAPDNRPDSRSIRTSGVMSGKTSLHFGEEELDELDRREGLDGVPSFVVMSSSRESSAAMLSKATPFFSIVKQVLARKVQEVELDMIGCMS